MNFPNHPIAHLSAALSRICPFTRLPPQLKRDLAVYYGYNSFLLDQILGLFKPAEAVEFMEACEVPRPVGGGGWGDKGVARS
jgi:hypothetical protein